MRQMKIFGPRRNGKTSYRFQRLWLTPLFRLVVRVGLPAVSVLLIATWYLSDETRVDTLRATISNFRAGIEQRPEFMVNLMQLNNVSDEVAEDIREVTAVDFPISSFDLDLGAMRKRIEGLDAVERVELVVRSGGILDVSVTERKPAIVWRGREDLEVLDANGHRVGPLEARSDRPDLPLIAGDEADRKVPEALAILAAAAPIANRVRGLLRVGARRWDLVLDRNQRILLPENNPIGALESIIALNENTELLDRDLTVVDLRDSRRPILRLGATAQKYLYQLTNATTQAKDATR